MQSTALAAAAGRQPSLSLVRVDVSATDSTRRLLPPLGLVSKPYCLTSLSDLQNSYLLDCDVDDSAPLSTGEVEDSNSPPLVKQLLLAQFHTLSR